MNRAVGTRTGWKVVRSLAMFGLATWVTFMVARAENPSGPAQSKAPLTNGSLAAATHESGVGPNSIPTYNVVAELPICNATLSGQSSPLSWNTGYTVAAINSLDPAASRFIVSAAYAGMTESAPKLRIVAKSTDGNLLMVTSETTASAASLTLGVMTIDCQFDLPAKSIDKLLVQKNSN